MPLNERSLALLRALTPSVTWDEEKTERFSTLYDLLLETNEKVNVTALLEETDVTLKHFVDSLTLLSVPEILSAPASASFCDLGCGGGFPGVPLAIARPGTDLVMVDSTEKKIRALEENIRRLGIAGARTLCARGEEMGLPDSPWRERFDIVVSRAVAPLPLLTELCLPLVKPGGIFVAMKGAVTGEERLTAGRAAGQLGAAIPEVLPVTLPAVSAEYADLPAVEAYLSAARNLVVFRKVKATPNAFPRTWAKMKKKPL